MAVCKRILTDRRGSIGLAVLAGVLCVAACLHAVAFCVRQEAEETQRRLVRRQLQFAVQALAKANYANADLPTGSVTLPSQKLYPNGYVLNAGLTAEPNECGVTRYVLTAEAGGQSLALRQHKIILPPEIAALAAKYTLAAGKSLSGAEHLPQGTAYAAELGNILDAVNIKSYAPFKELAFPAKSSFEEQGLSGALYYDDGNYSKTIASTSKNIKGRGVLIAMPSIFVADSTKLPDFCIIISDGQIEIGKNAELGRALLLSRYDITIKSGAQVSGIALCDGNLTIESGAAFTRDETVLQPFVTALRLTEK